MVPASRFVYSLSSGTHTEAMVVITASALAIEGIVCGVSVILAGVAYGAMAAKRCHWTVRSFAWFRAPASDANAHAEGCSWHNIFFGTTRIVCVQVPVIFAIETAEHGLAVVLGGRAFLLFESPTGAQIPVPWLKLIGW